MSDALNLKTTHYIPAAAVSLTSQSLLSALRPVPLPSLPAAQVQQHVVLG